MADGFRDLGTKAEAFRQRVGPYLDGLVCGDSVEGRIAFDGGQPPGILVQKIRRFCTLGVKVSNPALKRPDRTANIKIHV